MTLHRKLVRLIFNTTEAEVKCVKISGRVKAAVRDVDAHKSLKVILRMVSNCGASRFSMLRIKIFLQPSSK